MRTGICKACGKEFQVTVPDHLLVNGNPVTCPECFVAQGHNRPVVMEFTQNEANLLRGGLLYAEEMAPVEAKVFHSCMRYLLDIVESAITNSGCDIIPIEEDSDD